MKSLEQGRRIRHRRRGEGDWARPRITGQVAEILSPESPKIVQSLAGVEPEKHLRDKLSPQWPKTKRKSKRTAAPGPTGGTMTYENTANQIGTSPTLKISAKAKAMKAEGIDIIDLSVGEPDFPTPDNIKAAGIKAIQQNFTKYTENEGTPGPQKSGCRPAQRGLRTQLRGERGHRLVRRQELPLPSVPGLDQ